MMRSKERGSAIIEFAVCISALLLLFLGVVDFSMAIARSMLLTGSAEAGARYGAADGNANDIAGMTAAASKAAYGVSGLTVKASTWCACSAGGGMVSCTTTCNTYDLPIQYVQTQTSATVPLLFRFSGIPLAIQLSGSATLRAR